MEELLRYDHVDISYNGIPAVQDVSFTLRPGEILGIVGESGCGKSTLLKAAMGLLGSSGMVTRGDIWYKGWNLPDLPARELRKLNGPELGMIFQSAGSSFCPIRTVGAQLYEIMTQHGSATKKEFENCALELLEKLGFVDIIYPEYDMATKLAYRINKSKIREYLEFSNDYSIIEIAVPEKWVGKTLRSLDVRNTYGINVIAISHPSSHSVDISINPNNPLSKDDALVLLGTDEIIMKFAKKVE